MTQPQFSDLECGGLSRPDDDARPDALQPDAASNEPDAATSDPASRLRRAARLMLERVLWQPAAAARQRIAATARSLAWPLAAVTGTIGIVLLLLMQLSTAISSKAAGEAREADAFRAQVEPIGGSWRDSDQLADRGKPWWFDHDDHHRLEPAGASFIEDEHHEHPVPLPEPDLPPLPASASHVYAPDIDLALDVAHYADDDEPLIASSEAHTRWGDAPLHRGLHSPPPRADDPWDAFDRQRAEASRRGLAENPLLAAHLDSHAEPPLEPFEPETAPEGLARFDVSIEKHVPAESVVFEPLDYEIVVRNTGDDEIPQVNIDELLPQSQRVQQTIPAARVAGQSVSWQLRDIGPGEIRKLHVRTLPTAAGVDDSAALVEATAAVMATTRVAVPRLRLEVLPPECCAAGRLATLTFRVTNEGEVETGDVLLRTDLPAHLSHPLGRELDYPLGTLAPGETRETTLMARAETVGADTHWSDVVSDGQSLDQAEYDLRVELPSLVLRREGVKQPQVGETVEFVNHLFNRGERDFTRLEVVETVPEGYEIVSVADGGQVDPARGTVRWQLEQLAAGRRMTLAVTLRATRPGTLRSVVTVRGEALPEETMQATITARQAAPAPAAAPHSAVPRLPAAAPWPQSHWPQSHWPQSPYRQAWPFGGLRSGCVP